MAITTLSSPLKSAANKIVAANLNSSTSLSKAKKEYIQLRDFLEVRTKELENTPIPDKRALKKLGSINVVNTFGSAGGLLEGLLGGALDLGELVSGFFPGENKKIGSAPNIRGSKPRAALKGGKLNLGGIKALGIANAVFAGLDFATGLAEGESIGKSAAGTSGALAGSLLGGAIGQALIPIPGVGFVIGSAAGSFLGGYTADRAFDAVASQNVIKAEQEAKLKAQSKSQEDERKAQVSKQNDLLESFDSVAKQFQGFVNKITGNEPKPSGLNANQEDMPMDYGLGDNPGQGDPGVPGELQDVIAEGGELPSAIVSSEYGWRNGRIHAGVDYPRNTGTPVSLIQPGVVTYAGVYPGYGNYVEVSHPGGNSTSYAHLSRINVRVGQQIEPGMVIGNTGSTGRSTGPHVHFELRPKGGSPVQIGRNEGDKYFRFGGNVKVRPKAEGKTGAPGTSAKDFERSQLTSFFGSKESFRRKQHEGIDISTPQGTPISFKTGGEIVSISKTESAEREANGGYGNYIDVKLDNGNILRLAHLSSIPNWAKKGGKFNPGEVVAFSGGEKGIAGSGRSSNPHIHLEQHSKPGMNIEETLRGKIDPLKYGGFTSLQRGGIERGAIAPSKTLVSPTQPKPARVDQRMSYRPSPSTTIVNNSPILAMVGSGGGSENRATVSTPPIASTGGGSPVAIVIANSMGTINKIQEMKYA